MGGKIVRGNIFRNVHSMRIPVLPSLYKLYKGISQIAINIGYLAYSFCPLDCIE
jgi:hypothetical protein